MPAVKRVGHKGADLIAPGNTPASFYAALAAGVDMIEFDVLPERTDGSGQLWLAHDYTALRGPDARPTTLEEGLEHLAHASFADVELDVDLKLEGYELRVLDALRRHGLVERALVSSQIPESLARLRAAEPRLRLGLSVPRLKRDPMRSPFTAAPAYAMLQLVRRTLPRRAAAEIRAGRIDALMAHWRLVTPALVRAIRAAGGELYVWTVDEMPLMARLVALGADAIITNDPRLFAQLEPRSQTAAL